MVTSRQTFTTCPQQLAAIRKHLLQHVTLSLLLNCKENAESKMSSPNYSAWQLDENLRQNCQFKFESNLHRGQNFTCRSSIPLQRKLVVSKWQSHSPPKNIQLKSGTFLKYMWADKISDEWYRVQQWSPAILHSCNVKMPLYQNAANNWENKDIYIWGCGFAPICETCEIGRIKLHCWVVITRCIELWAFYWFVCEFFLVTY